MVPFDSNAGWRIRHKTATPEKANEIKGKRVCRGRVIEA